MMNLCLIDCYLNRGVMCLIWEGAEPPASLVLDITTKKWPQKTPHSHRAHRRAQVRGHTTLWDAGPPARGPGRGKGPGRPPPTPARAPGGAHRRRLGYGGWVEAQVACATVAGAPMA